MSLPVDPYDKPRRVVFAATMLLLASVMAYGVVKLLGVLT
jgi:hypothetical protein